VGGRAECVSVEGVWFGGGFALFGGSRW
jgi:hypothetical protein